MRPQAPLVDVGAGPLDLCSRRRGHRRELWMMSALREASATAENDAPVTPVHRATIDHPSAWKVADFATPADYTIELSPAQLRDIEGSVARIKAAGLGLDDLRREHFELPSLSPAIDEIRHQTADGRGFVVV